jgi:large subunit ribosomal protein L31
MKKKIHPKYNPSVEVKCACGNSFKVGSTANEITVEICSECHPFYTGKEKLVDSTGRVDRFKQRLQKTTAMKKTKKTDKKKPTKASTKKKTEKAENAVEKKTDKK